MAAGLPFDGPVGAAQIGYIDGQFVINPSNEQLEKSQLNLLVAGKRDSINMIECEGLEFPDDLMKEAFTLGQKVINEACDLQLEFLNTLDIEQKEVTFNKPTDKTIEFVESIITEEKLEAMAGHTKVSFNDLFSQYEKECLEAAAEKAETEEAEDFTESKVKMAVFNVVKHFIRERTLSTGKRVDDREIKDIRPLYCEINNLPRVHGSGLFWR